ncbi:hypothetical protein NDU88_001708 [Pleurodeles waltl]|uniref:Retrotransposon gag domain-containing protein n=1 Tax=Pleurodeles waltl TaxID=8319 RepID=A0AAV7W008_PLEWA|nr:hypothetical protein NDU88_001708 [Pleurodeles waltl]
MEEVEVADHQDDLEKMLAPMRTEALKQGKDWLRAKMEERVADGDVSQVLDPNLTMREDTNGPGSEGHPTHKANKRQRMEGKPTKKVAKRPKAANPPTQAPAAVEAPESSGLWKPSEGEHISAIIKGSFQSFAQLLLKSSGAEHSLGHAGKGGSQETLNKREGTGAQVVRSDQSATGDQTLAWGKRGKEQETARSVGQSPEAYLKPSLGPPAMTTRSAGLANAIPLTVKERIWLKEFIDIFSLLEIQLEGLDLTVCDKKDKDMRERKKVRKERNFENWLDAFRIMACKIVEKFPRCAADLWLYESKIHEAHRQFPGDAWLEYDKSFRLKMQANPEMEWNEEDVSSYIHTMMVAREVRSWSRRKDHPFCNMYHKGKHKKTRSFHRFKPWHSGKG